MAFSVTGIILLKSTPSPDAWGWSFLLEIGKGFASIIIMVVGAALAGGLTMPLWKKVESFHLPSMKKAALAKACSHLRDYYGLQEPFIITKCFDASDASFRNHDVCIFAVGDEMRITTDLIHGFLYGDRDLGCYAFKKHEVMLIKRQEEKRLCVELKADNITFLLGYRAKSFIEKIW